MKILVIGGTGVIGAQVVKELVARGEQVRVLTRRAEIELPPGAEAVHEDLMDPASVKSALSGVDRAFLLVAGGAADELTQGLLALELIREAGLSHVTYLSVYQVERFADIPHFIGKYAVEQALRQSGVPFTILRPGYFFQNDLQLQAPLTQAGLYPSPVGHAGVAAVDVRDIAEAAAISLTSPGHGGKSYDLIAADPVSGPGAAAMWSAALGRPIHYPEIPLPAFENQLRQNLPAWYAMELRMMFQAYQERGFAPEPEAVTVLTELLGRAPRSYADFVTETAAAWRA